MLCQMLHVSGGGASKAFGAASYVAAPVAAAVFAAATIAAALIITISLLHLRTNTYTHMCVHICANNGTN